MDSVSAFTRDVLDDTVAETMRSLKPLLLDRGFSLSQVLRLQALWSAKLELAVAKYTNEGGPESENTAVNGTPGEQESSNAAVERLVHSAKQRFVNLKAASRIVPDLGPDDPRNSLVPGRPDDFVPQAVSSAPSFMHEGADVDDSTNGNSVVADVVTYGRSETSSQAESSDNDDGAAGGNEAGSDAEEQDALDAMAHSNATPQAEHRGAIGEPSDDNVVSIALQPRQGIEGNTTNINEDDDHQAEFGMSGTDSDDDVPDYLKGLEEESDVGESEEEDIGDASSISNMGATDSARAEEGGRGKKDSDDSSIDLDEFSSSSSSSADEDEGKGSAHRGTAPGGDHALSSATTLQEKDGAARANDLRPRSVIVAQCDRRVERSSWFGRASIARFRNAAVASADDGAAVTYGIGKPGKRWLFHLRFVLMNVHGEPIRALHELQVRAVSILGALMCED